MTQQLVLVSARKSRGGDHWSLDDYDVRLGDGKGKVVGRIFKIPHAPKDLPWFWTIVELKPRRLTDRGYVASRAEAMAKFKFIITVVHEFDLGRQSSQNSAGLTVSTIWAGFGRGGKNSS